MNLLIEKSMLLLILIAAVLCYAEPPTGDYQLVWAEEFDGTSLDTAKWDYRNLGPRRDGINVRESIQLDGNGLLAIITREVDGEYHTGMIGTQGKYEFQFGYLECRVRFQNEVGHWSAFWLQSPTVGVVGDTRETGTEIDIFEYLVVDPDEIKMNLHWDGYGDDHKHTGSSYTASGITDGFHLIGLEWTEEEYIFYVDGEEVWRTNTAVSGVQEYIILSLEVGTWAGDIAQAGLPDSVLFDYVRVYQKNITQIQPVSNKLIRGKVPVSNMELYVLLRDATRFPATMEIYNVSGRIQGKTSPSLGNDIPLPTGTYLLHRTR
jgi:beta-glucanase (GH16 family)